MPIEESTIILLFIGSLIGALLKVLIDIDHHFLELKYAVNNLDPSPDNTDEIADIKEMLSELKGMINIMAHYLKIFRPPGGQT